MKIFSAEQIKAADAYTIKHEPIKSVDLMERAAGKCYEWIYDNAPRLFPPALTEESQWLFHVICGVGNNGGDGLVLARMLNRSGYNVAITVVHYADKPSDDFNTNLGRLGTLKKSLTDVRKEKDLPAISPDCVVIDALFGIGINRPPSGLAAAAIDHINRSGATIVSIDMPSGLPCDHHDAPNLDLIVRSDHVLTFQSPKLSFFLAETAPVVGQVHVLNIGMHPAYLSETETDYHLIDHVYAKAIRRPRPRFSHKGNYGHALLIGGQPGQWGSICLSAKSCLRAGAGLLTVHTGSQGIDALSLILPEAMSSLEENGHFAYLPDLKSFNAIGAGPGLGQNEETERALKLLIQETTAPLVLDADALNLLANNRTWLSFLPKGTILTPHPGEFARLIGEKMSHYDGMQRQRELSMKLGIYIILKGAHSSLSTPDGKILINLSGNPGMASAGMGDALTGIITGLLASGYNNLNAAALGMYIHGLAGDLANQSPESLLASDLIDNLGNAFNHLNEA